MHIQNTIEKRIVINNIYKPNKEYFIQNNQKSIFPALFEIFCDKPMNAPIKTFWQRLQKHNFFYVIFVLVCLPNKGSFYKK